MRESISVSGEVALTFRRNGEITDKLSGKNLVVTSGKALIVSRLGSNSEGPVSFVAMGAGTSVANAAETALVAEIERVAAVNTSINNLFSLQATLGGSILTDTSVAEFGLFSQSSGGILLARFVIAERTFVPGDEILVEWTLQFGV